MIATDTPLTVYQDKNGEWECLVTKVSDGLAKDISLAEIQFSMKKVITQTTADLVRQNTAAGGGDTEIEFTTDGTDGKFKIKLVPANTASLATGVYFYSAEIIISTLEQIVLNGKITILAHAI